MKRLHFLFFFFLIFFSCSTEDENSNKTNDDFLIGKWQGIEDFDNGEVFPYDSDDEYWIFTETQATFYQNGNDGTTVEYEYRPDKEEIVLGSFVNGIDVVNRNKIRIGNKSMTQGATYVRSE